MKICNFVSLSLVLAGTSAEAQNPELFPQEQIDKGAEVLLHLLCALSWDAHGLSRRQL